MHGNRSKVDVDVVEQSRHISGFEGAGEVQADVRGAVFQGSQQSLVDGLWVKCILTWVLATEGFPNAPTVGVVRSDLCATDEWELARSWAFRELVRAGVERANIDTVIGGLNQSFPNIERYICNVLLVHPREYLGHALIPGILQFLEVWWQRGR